MFKGSYTQKYVRLGDHTCINRYTLIKQKFACSHSKFLRIFKFSQENVKEKLFVILSSTYVYLYIYI